MFIPPGPVTHSIPWRVGCISADHLVIWSYLMPHFDVLESYWSPCSSLEGFEVFLYFFCLQGVWPSTPASSTYSATYRPLTHRRGSDMTVRKSSWGILWRLGQSSHLCTSGRSCARFSFSLSLGDVVSWSPFGCNSRLSSLRTGSKFSYLPNFSVPGVWMVSDIFWMIGSSWAI